MLQRSEVLNRNRINFTFSLVSFYSINKSHSILSIVPEVLQTEPLSSVFMRIMLVWTETIFFFTQKVFLDQLLPALDRYLLLFPIEDRNADPECKRHNRSDVQSPQKFWHGFALSSFHCCVVYYNIIWLNKKICRHRNVDKKNSQSNMYLDARMGKWYKQPLVIHKISAVD